MRLKSLEISGFKSFAKKGTLEFDSPISAIVGPNGSGKSNIAESFRFVLGEQSIKSMRGKKGEDLIFNGTSNLPKKNKASVKVYLDNSDRTLDIDYDEVVIERTVHRDGVNDYNINNSPVRLKDISELLSGANIGSTGHHIISQGEADRILNSSVKDRRAMLEDALGLKVFQYKKIESERKLIKTEENIAQVNSLRREIAPHIKFLKKQVAKIEESRELREKLQDFYKKYLKYEKVYLDFNLKNIDEELVEPVKNLREINEKIEQVKRLFEESDNSNNHHKEIEQKLNEVNSDISDLTRQIGQIEGEINSLEKLKNEANSEDRIQKIVSYEDAQDLKDRVEALIKESEDSNDLGYLKNVLLKIKDAFNAFLSTGPKVDHTLIEKYENDIRELNNKKVDLEKNIIDFENKKLELNEKIKKDAEESKGGEKEIYELMTQKNDLESRISRLRMQKDTLLREEEEFKRELTEAGVLIGRNATNYESIEVPDQEILNEERIVQRERRRELEKMKIRVEEFGSGSGEEVVKEYQDVTERDEFLIKEIEDLEMSSVSLKQLIAELDEQINTKFKEGIDKINDEFHKYFELMFGGGEAALRLVKPQVRRKRDTDLDMDEDNIGEDEENDTEEGVDIHVSLPRKKTKGLIMLSGGERALTSIALIFAMSAVNPPPFIILDETDAALDEANSKKYADMIENLSKHSQLILITHNRETMSRAGVLYGVTMTSGSSQLLSIKFDEGVQYAK